MLQVGSLQPPGHDIGHFPIIYQSNDPQIFHLPKVHPSTINIGGTYTFHIFLNSNERLQILQDLSLLHCSEMPR